MPTPRQIAEGVANDFICDTDLENAKLTDRIEQVILGERSQCLAAICKLCGITIEQLVRESKNVNTETDS